MAFTDTIRSIPFAASTPNGRGFLPPMLRGMGHLLYLLGCLADEAMTVTVEQATTELTAAREHWNARTATENVSTATLGIADLLATAIGEAIREYPDWGEDARISNLRDLNHRILAFSASLDRELVGLRDSDAGTAL